MSNYELKLMHRDGRKLIAEIVSRVAIGDMIEFIDSNGDVTLTPGYMDTARIKDPAGNSNSVGVPALFKVLEPYRLTCGYSVIPGKELMDTKWDVTDLDITQTVAILVMFDIIDSF